MTTRHPTESTTPSRRALLAGALGGIGAWVASAVGRVNPARAEGQAMVVGGEYDDATSVTKLHNGTTGDTVFWALSSSGIGVVGASTSDIGVVGTSSSDAGVYGQSGSSAGVSGYSTSGAGIRGEGGTGVGVRGIGSSNAGVVGISESYRGVSGASTTDVGVFASSSEWYGLHAISTFSIGTASENFAPNKPAMRGWALGDSTGVLGHSGAGDPPAAKPKTGVFGHAAQDDTSTGVWGDTTSGHAVHGTATTGFAGYFAGKVFTTKFHELQEIGVPAAPSAGKGRLFMRDNGAGKTQLCVRFNTGAVQVLATQP